MVITLASATITSCSAFSCLLGSKLLYFAFNFETEIILVIRFPSDGGNEGCAITSLKVRWGSGVMRHIENSGDAFSECKRGILLGLRRLWETIGFFVVTRSQRVSDSEGGGVDEDEEGASRDFLLEDSAVLRAVV